MHMVIAVTPSDICNLCDFAFFSMTEHLRQVCSAGRSGPIQLHADQVWLGFTGSPTCAQIADRQPALGLGERNLTWGASCWSQFWDEC